MTLYNTTLPSFLGSQVGNGVEGDKLADEKKFKGFSFFLKKKKHYCTFSNLFHIFVASEAKRLLFQTPTFSKEIPGKRKL